MSIVRGFVELAQSDRAAALERLGQVPEAALRSVEVRLALRALRANLTAVTAP